MKTKTNTSTNKPNTSKKQVVTAVKIQYVSKGKYKVLAELLSKDDLKKYAIKSGNIDSASATQRTKYLSLKAQIEALGTYVNSEGEECCFGAYTHKIGKTKTNK